MTFHAIFSLFLERLYATKKSYNEAAGSAGS